MSSISQTSVNHEASKAVETIFEKNGHRMIINYPTFKGEYNIAKLEEVRFVYVKAEVTQEMRVPVEIKEDQVLLYFCLDGTFHAYSETFGQIPFISSTHNVLYTHPLKALFHFSEGSYEAFYITLPFAVFNRYFPKSETVFENFYKQMKAGYFSVLREKPGMLSVPIYRVIKEIREFTKDNEFRDIFLKGKIMELLSIQLEELCTVCDATPPARKIILEKMYRVRDFISAHLAENHSLHDLAQVVGTNEYTLKHEFKELFGTTVFGFWADLKMETAAKLLVEKEKSIAEISEVVGYKNPQHFSTAFKRKFGVSPSNYQKQL